MVQSQALNSLSNHLGPHCVTLRSSGVLLTTIASLLWGTTLVATGIGLQHANPYNLLFLRFTTASTVVIILAFLLNRRFGIKQELCRSTTWVLSAIYASGFLLQYVGQDLANASDATLLSNLAPALVPIAAFVLLKEGFSNVRIAATILSLLGLALVSSPRLHLGSSSLVGDLLLFGASLCYAFFIVLSKRLNATSVGSAFAIMISTTAFLAPVAVFFGGLNPFGFQMDLAGWASIMYLGVPCSVLAISLYLKGLKQITASQSASLLLLQLPTGLILAASILGETLSLFAIAGAASVTAAIILSSIQS